MHVLGTLVLIACGLAGWWFLSPTRRFLQGFALLLERPMMRRGLTGFLTGRSAVAGRFNGREVLLEVVQPIEERAGQIVLWMQTSAPDRALWKDSSLTTRDPSLSRATFDLEGRYELILTLAGGWLQAVWTPLRLRFPGPFDATRWRHTLSQMHLLVMWLETQPSLRQPMPPLQP